MILFYKKLINFKNIHIRSFVLLVFILFILNFSKWTIAETSSKQQLNRIVQENLLSEVTATTDQVFKDSLKISPDGKKIAYLCYDPMTTKYFMRVNNLNHPLFEGIWPGIALFGPDSEHIAYVGVKNVGKGTKTRLFAVLDGIRTSESYDAMAKGGMLFSPNSQKLCYVAKNAGKWFVEEQYSGIKHNAFDGVIENTLGYSPDSEHLYYGVKKEDTKECFMVVDGILYKPYPVILSAIVTNKHFVYVAGDGKKQFIVFDGVEQKSYDFVADTSLLFSPDGKRFVYAANNGGGVNGEEFVVLDGKELKHYRRQTDKDNRTRSGMGSDCFVFSPDSKSFAYSVIEDYEQFAVLNNIEQKKYKGISNKTLAFSPDSQRFGYIATDGEKLLTVIDKEEYPIDGKWAGKFCFSPDSRHFAYVVADNNGWSVAIDGEKGKSYDLILLDERKTLFDEDDSFHYIAMRGNNVYLVEEKLEQE